MKRFEPFDLILTILVSCIAAFVIITDAGIVRIPLGIALVFVLPGYGILSAWYPKWLSQFATGTLLILMLSITTAMLGGLVLHYSPWGLQPTSWALWMAGIAVINSVIALVRREDVSDKPKIATALPTRLRLDQVLLMAASVVVVVIALSTARTSVMEQPRPAFTQLWIEPSDNSTQFRVGVHSEEDVPLDFRLELTSAAEDGETETLESLEFTLAPQQSHEMDFDIPELNEQGINAALYRLDQPTTIYRSVHLNVHLAPNAPAPTTG